MFIFIETLHVVPPKQMNSHTTWLLWTGIRCLGLSGDTWGLLQSRLSCLGLKTQSDRWEHSQTFERGLSTSSHVGISTVGINTRNLSICVHPRAAPVGRPVPLPPACVIRCVPPWLSFLHGLRTDLRSSRLWDRLFAYQVTCSALSFLFLTTHASIIFISPAHTHRLCTQLSRRRIEGRPLSV